MLSPSQNWSALDNDQGFERDGLEVLLSEHPIRLMGKEDEELAIPGYFVEVRAGDNEEELAALIGKSEAEDLACLLTHYLDSLPGVSDDASIQELETTLDEAVAHLDHPGSDEPLPYVIGDFTAIAALERLDNRRDGLSAAEFHTIATEAER